VDSIRTAGLPALQASVSNDSKPSKVSEAASQFEALLIASMLKASREGGSSWMSSGEDAAGESATSFAEEHLAQVLASQGGLGIARMVVRGLEVQNRPYATATASGSKNDAEGTTRGTTLDPAL
jgi:Rod binding domain-containing protein